ncbi:TRAP transporter small permease subunit [Paracoccus sp. (in: a-proteobacteria)]|uniref:TRAP transporter small permease subunit n=1 Tax=Paracoccus sp. TaxID=267 RepID=UPI003A8A6B5C
MDSIAHSLLRAGERVSRYAVWFGGALILAAAGLVCAEVILRKAFGISTGGADELSGYALAIGTSWSAGFTLLNRAHVRVDAVYARMGERVRGGLDCLAIIAMTVFAVALAWFCLGVLRDSVALGARSATTLSVPLWIPQGLWVAGLLLFAATSLLLTALAIPALLRHDSAGLHGLAGGRSADEEIRAELDTRLHAPKEA